MRLAMRFAGGALLGLGGTLVLVPLLLGPAARMVGNGLPAFLVVVALTAASFFVGGLLAGAALGPSGRLGLGVVFLSAGVLLPFWMLVSGGGGLPWQMVPMRVLASAMLWAAAGLAGGLILRSDRVTLGQVVTGFTLGGLVGGLGYAAGGFLLWELQMAVVSRQLSMIAAVTNFALVVVLPPFIAGALLDRTPSAIATVADPDPV